MGKFKLMTPVDLSAAIKSDIWIAHKNQFHDLRPIAAIMLVSKGVFGKLQYSPYASSCAHYEQHILHAIKYAGKLGKFMHIRQHIVCDTHPFWMA